MDRIGSMADVPEAESARRRDDVFAPIQVERIFHVTKPSRTRRRCRTRQFVFLSCAQARTGSVVHTTVDADVQSAWSHTPKSIKLATTHIVRCETEILRVRPA